MQVHTPLLPPRNGSTLHRPPTTDLTCKPVLWFHLIMLQLMHVFMFAGDCCPSHEWKQRFLWSCTGKVARTRAVSWACPFSHVQGVLRRCFSFTGCMLTAALFLRKANQVAPKWISRRLSSFCLAVATPLPDSMPAPPALSVSTETSL